VNELLLGLHGRRVAKELHVRLCPCRKLRLERIGEEEFLELAKDRRIDSGRHVEKCRYMLSSQLRLQLLEELSTHQNMHATQTSRSGRRELMSHSHIYYYYWYN
jgi:hypothetical protein